jgi:hypothetical protein
LIEINSGVTVATELNYYFTHFIYSLFFIGIGGAGAPLL